MNALKAIGVLIMQLATTLQGVTTVLAILDIQTIEAPAQVIYLSIAYLMMLILIFLFATDANKHH